MHGYKCPINCTRTRIKGSPPTTPGPSGVKGASLPDSGDTDNDGDDDDADADAVARLESAADEREEERRREDAEKEEEKVRIAEEKAQAQQTLEEADRKVRLIRYRRASAVEMSSVAHVDDDDEEEAQAEAERRAAEEAVNLFDENRARTESVNAAQLELQTAEASAQAAAAEAAKVKQANARIQGRHARFRRVSVGEIAEQAHIQDELAKVEANEIETLKALKRAKEQVRAGVTIGTSCRRRFHNRSPLLSLAIVKRS